MGVGIVGDRGDIDIVPDVPMSMWRKLLSNATEADLAAFVAGGRRATWPQLQRIRDAGVTLTAAVDKVAASGGYLMAAVAEKILAAPFALVGSIGVIAQIPNVHRLLKKHDVDVELHTAGQYKRTLTMFGENTEEGRRKFQEELEDVHALFQEFVRDNRPDLDMATVSTGESWYGRRAVDLRLVDELLTSDEYMVRACDDANVVEVKWVAHRKPLDRLISELTGVVERLWFRGRGI